MKANIKDALELLGESGLVKSYIAKEDLGLGIVSFRCRVTVELIDDLLSTLPKEHSFVPELTRARELLS